MGTALKREHHFYKEIARRLNESPTFGRGGPRARRICDAGYTFDSVECTGPKRESRKAQKTKKTCMFLIGFCCDPGGGQGRGGRLLARR